MGPQCEDGYTKIANELLDALCRFRIPGESMQIFLAILRRTYGYGKKEDIISITQLETATGIVKNHIPRAVGKLVAMGIVTKNGERSRTSYKVNKYHELWKESPKMVTPKKSPKMVTRVTQNGDRSHPKWCLQKKERKKKDIGELLPICCAWKSYLEMRVKIRKPASSKAMEMAVSKLAAMEATGQDPIAILDQSTFNSWQGLFPVKGSPAPAATKSEPSQTEADLRAKGLIE